MITDETVLDDLLTFFKALIDPDRLMLAGRLVGAAQTIEALAAEAGLARIDVQRHLDYLIHAGLVTVSDTTYAIDRGTLHQQAKRVLASKISAAPPANALEKVLRDYVRPDGSLKEIPGQLKKRIIIYEHIAKHFEMGRHYTEKEVNEILKRFHPDVVSIRRDLFDLGFINRKEDGSDYWRTEADTF
jgi:hypothetical protein